MDEIINLYNEHLKTSFPDRRGEVILGIDVVLLDSDTAGLISKYIRSRGQLADVDVRTLSHCYSDLKTVVKELNGSDRQYFSRLQNIAGLIIENIKTSVVSPDRKLFKPEWESSFLKIRKILNEWDPIGVADSVEDEYDTMNFRALSVLMNKGGKKEIKRILADYTKNTTEITVDDETLDKVSERIAKLE